MEINSDTYKSANFGITVSPKMKYTLFKETKKFYSRKEASKLLSLVESVSDKYTLENFKMSIPNKREKSIFCDIFIKSKQKSGKNCLIHAFLGKLKDKNVNFSLLEKSLREI